MSTRTALRAMDIMTSDMITVDADASIREAAALLIDHGISGAPVRDEFGRIIGLLSLRDVARYAREGGEGGGEPPAQVGRAESSRSGRHAPAHLPWGFHFEAAEGTQVRQFMTPILITMPREATLSEVSSAMLERRVHRILVRDVEGEIVGIISALDVLRAMSEPGSYSRKE
jgi:CBS domain-containing protein